MLSGAAAFWAAGGGVALPDEAPEEFGAAADADARGFEDGD